MYHCYIHFYLIGHPCRAFEIIRKMPPLEHFTHEFSQSGKPEEALAARADVIFANLQNMDVKEALQILTLGKHQEAELILLAEKNQIMLLAEDDLADAGYPAKDNGTFDAYNSSGLDVQAHHGSLLDEIKDIWTRPMSDAVVRFRFLRWQQTYKMSKDFWQTNHYLESTINNSPSLVWYKNKDGIHEKVNDSFCKTVGKTKKQVEGRRHAYIWDVEQDDPACIESELEVMDKRKTCISEETIQTGDGKRLLMTYKSPLYNLDGSVMGTVGVALDITQVRAYEQEIIKKNHTLETIFTSLDCGIMCHTLDGRRITSVNRAALKILGYESQEELMAEGFDMVAASVVEEDKERVQECIKTLHKEGDSISVEYRVRHKDGEILHVMGNVKLLKENGELLYQRFLLDCTDQKLQEQKNERRQMELIQALGIDYNLVCFFDLDTGMGRTLRIDDDAHMLNSVFAGEISLKESMELYIQKFVYEEDRKMLRQAFSQDRIKRELAEKNLYYVNYRIFSGNEMKYFQIRVVRAGEWRKSHGIVLGFRSVEEEMRNELEKQHMLEDALLQANNANRAKSAFLSNMSHDIRTPMNAIVGFTNLAMTHIDKKEQVEEYLGKIQTSGNHLLSLINDVLDMSHIESGKVHLDEKPCSLPEIIQGLRNMVQAAAGAKQLELHIDMVNVSDEEIYCDELRLNQVLLNLLSNAVKYTNAGGKVDMRVTEKAGAPMGYANYEFYIRDNGIGMSEEFVAHIFEPFEREQTSTISGIQGTGLGMAITKNIVNMMDGTIEVKSEKGGGSEFTVLFTFRLGSGAKKQQDTSELDKKADGSERRKINSGRILLAEDVEMNQEIATAILGEAGFDTEVAGNGQIAVDMLKKSEPGYYQLILMDVQMPVMNGYEATKEIRSLEKKELASIPIIAMTANAFEEDKKEALKCGMNGHIAKPIDIEQLFDTLDKVLQS